MLQWLSWQEKSEKSYGLPFQKTRVSPQRRLCRISGGSWMLSQAPPVIPSEEPGVQSGRGVHDLGRC